MMLPSVFADFDECGRSIDIFKSEISRSLYTPVHIEFDSLTVSNTPFVKGGVQIKSPRSEKGFDRFGVPKDCIGIAVLFNKRPESRDEVNDHLLCHIELDACHFAELANLVETKLSKTPKCAFGLALCDDGEEFFSALREGEATPWTEECRVVVGILGISVV